MHHIFSAGTLFAFPFAFYILYNCRHSALISHQKKYDAQQKEIARLNELIEKFKHKPKKASMARSKKKVLERMQNIWL